MFDLIPCLLKHEPAAVLDGVAEQAVIFSAAAQVGFILSHAADVPCTASMAAFTAHVLQVRRVFARGKAVLVFVTHHVANHAFRRVAVFLSHQGIHCMRMG